MSVAAVEAGVRLRDLAPPQPRHHLAQLGGRGHALPAGAAGGGAGRGRALHGDDGHGVRAVAGHRHHRARVPDQSQVSMAAVDQSEVSMAAVDQ